MSITRAELLSRIEHRYQVAVAQAATSRDAELAAVEEIEPDRLALLVSLLEERPDERSSREINSTARVMSSPVQPVGSHSPAEPSAPAVEPPFGEISLKIRKTALSLQGEFTVHDIIRNGGVGVELKPQTISGVLAKMESKGVLECLQPGAGRRPSRFRVVRREEEVESES